MLPKPRMRMRLGSTHGKGAGSFTGAFDPAVSLLCGSIRPRFSHVAAACRQKKVQCVSGRLITCAVRVHVTPLIVVVSESRTTQREITAVMCASASWRVDRPAHDPHNPALHPPASRLTDT